MHAWHARPVLCAFSARNPRHKASCSGNVRSLARRKSAESLVFASGLASPRAEVTGSNPVGSAILFDYFKYFTRCVVAHVRPGTIA